MLEPIRLTRPVASNTKTIPDDVLALKAFLRAQGYYDAPDWGLTAYPDEALFAALEAYQADNGLIVDGIANPDGETEATIRAKAQQLQAMGRNGDTLLAHITLDEAALLEQRGGAGTRNPQTGLLEFYDSKKKTGKYIWHTAGDDKVRSSHAARDGQEFSWDDPPEGGHPGEAPNCRCTTEDVKEENNQACEQLKPKLMNKKMTLDELSAEMKRLSDEIKAIEVKIEKMRGTLAQFLADIASGAAKSILEGELAAKIASCPSCHTTEKFFGGDAKHGAAMGVIDPIIERLRIEQEIQKLEDEKELKVAIQKDNFKLHQKYSEEYDALMKEWKELGCA